MSVLPDWIIKNLAECGMIEPFVSELSETGKVSYGLSSYGYDARVSNKWKVFSNVKGTLVDPKRFDENNFIDLESDICIIPPNSFVLAKTVERFKIPKGIMVICLGKSTYARCGLIVNVTPLEPEWEGVVTIEISNTTPLPAKVYANEGICQFLFFKAESVCSRSYADRNGKYQNQVEIELPRIK